MVSEKKIAGGHSSKGGVQKRQKQPRAEDVWQ